MSPRNLSALFDPTGIVVVGASANPDKLGSVMARALSTSATPLALVNAQNPSSTLYESVAAAREALSASFDLAVLCVPASATAAALRESAEAGVRAALVCAGGFAEAGGVGVKYGTDVDDVIADTGIRLLGPNTSGFFVPRLRLRASFVPGVADVQPGRVGIVSASGGINHVLAFTLQRMGVGVSLGVGLGAAGDVAAPEVLDYLASDEHTSVVLLHIESVTDGLALLESVRQLARIKPVVALVVGKNDVAEFAQSHTGSLATAWRTTRDLLRQAGAVIVDDEDQLVVAGSVLSGVRAAAHPNLGVGVVTGQAGPGLIIIDTLKGAGVRLPRLAERTVTHLGTLLPPLTFQANPVDTGRPGPDFPEVLRTVAGDPEIDLVAVYTLTEPVIDLPAAVSAAGIDPAVPVIVGADGPDRELGLVKESAARHGVNVVAGPSALAHGVVAVVDDARSQFLAHQDRDDGIGLIEPHLVPPRDEWDEIAAKGLLNDLGIRTPERRRCRDRDEAHLALATLGGPVAVKLVDAGVLHKSDIGGVVLNVRTGPELDTALDALVSAGAREFLVERMAPPGVDLIVSARRDEVFGPIVLIGVGGITAEVLADVAVRAAPLGELAVDSMIDSLAAHELLRGFRGGPVIDRAELCGILGRLGACLTTNPHLREIEINPLRLTSAGLIALDGVVIGRKDVAS